MLVVLITGDRNATPEEWTSIVHDTVEIADMVIHGGAKGIDTIAGKEASDQGKEVMEFPAHWENYHRAAGPIRNAEMLKMLLDFEKGGHEIQVVAFHPDIDSSKGTKNMMKQAFDAGVHVALVNENGEFEDHDYQRGW